MELRVRYGNFDSDHDASGLAADAVLAFDLLARDIPWESLQAAERAFDEAPREALNADEIETLLRWRESAERAPQRGRRACSPRIGGYRLRAEPLERRDVPTPLFAVHFLIAGLAPPITAWENERSPAALLRQPVYIADDRTGAAEFPPVGELSAKVRPADDRRSAANDWAIVELLAASAPNSRFLEPLGCCA
ncbi:MAG TPA: hypothetical protein VMV10_21565 [Pirellulales bacterium]|nr:hypothetical protein [Pirellulales bacterium]